MSKKGTRGLSQREKEKIGKVIQRNKKEGEEHRIIGGKYHNKFMKEFRK